MKKDNCLMDEKRPGLFRGYGNPRIFWLRVVSILVISAAQPLLAAPFHLWFLHWFIWIPFLWVIQSQKCRGSLLLAYLGGTVANMFIFYWLVELLPNFTNISRFLSALLVFLLCSYLSIIWVILAWAIPRIRTRFPRSWIFLSPALPVSMEFLLPQLFPYMQGATHYQIIPIIQLSSLTGLYGVSFLLFWSNCVLYQMISVYRTEKKFYWKYPMMLVLTIVLVMAYGFSRLSLYRSQAKESRILKVGLIQANFTTADVSAMGFEKIHQVYMDLSQEAVKNGAEWIVWSEGEFLIPFSQPLAKKILSESSQLLGRPILVGGYGEKTIGGKYVSLNSAIHIDPASGLGKQYDKQILVPFGEYMPLEKYLSFIYNKINWTSRFYPGHESVVQSIQDIPYAFLICYEAIYPSLARKAVAKGARLLVNITYDAWFGRTTAPHQHLMLATIRSAEMGVPLIRLASTGITTTIDSLGRMNPSGSLFTRKVLIHQLPLVYIPTLYSRIGDVFAWSCVLISLVFVGIVVFSKTEKK